MIQYSSILPKRTALASTPLLGQELKKMVFDFIQSEVRKRIRESLDKFFSAEAIKAHWKNAVKKLVELGAITRKGHLAKETTIEDFLFGKYKDLFAKAANKEVLQEGLAITEAMKALFQWGKLNSEEWAREIRRELDMIKGVLETLGG